MHGGAKRSGAPIGNKNALKSGFYSASEVSWRREARMLVRTLAPMLEQD